VSDHIPVALRRAIRGQFHDRCAYCRTAERLTAVTFEIEHVVPRSSGGKTVLENLCLACPTCNRCKGDRTAFVDPDTGAEILLFHPQRDLWAEHFEWNDERTHIVPLTETGRVTITALRMNRPQMTRVRAMWVAAGEHPSPDE
jgi:hypothetical protein